MAQWTRTITVQAWGFEFELQHTHKVGMTMNACNSHTYKPKQQKTGTLGWQDGTFAIKPDNLSVTLEREQTPQAVHDSVWVPWHLVDATRNLLTHRWAHQNKITIHTCPQKQSYTHKHTHTHRCPWRSAEGGRLPEVVLHAIVGYRFQRIKFRSSERVICALIFLCSQTHTHIHSHKGMCMFIDALFTITKNGTSLTVH